MRQPSLLRRYILFFCGVLCAALGIALITLAGMGTSAVSSLSYVLTFVFPGLSLGVFTFLVNCTMLVGQVLLLRFSPYSSSRFRPRSSSRSASTCGRSCWPRWCRSPMGPGGWCSCWAVSPWGWGLRWRCFPMC